MTKALVPANHRMMEHALAEALVPLRSISPAKIETVWNAWESPKQLLPFLAYSVSVDFWDDAWDEATKRRVIAQSPAYHRRKGTRRAVDDAATYTGRAVMITEWHQFIPARRRGTFRVSLVLAEAETAVPAAEIVLLRRLVARAKPKSRAFSLETARVIDSASAVYVNLLSHGRVVVEALPDELIALTSSIVALRTFGRVTLEA